MHPADIVILAIIAISLVFGIFRGFVREAFSLVGWFSAYLVARLFHEPLANMLVHYISTPSLRMVTAWGVLFAATLLLSIIAGYMVMSLMDAAGVRGIDRFLGAIFGLVRGLILVLVLLVLAAPFANRDEWWQSAMLPREFMRYEPAGRELESKLMHAAKHAGQGQQEAPAANGAAPATDSQP
jgi:membrane protein required for colicin V production